MKLLICIPTSLALVYNVGRVYVRELIFYLILLVRKSYNSFKLKSFHLMIEALITPSNNVVIITDNQGRRQLRS